MSKKNRLRKKFFIHRKKKYFDIEPSFFNPISKIIKKKFRNRKVNLSSYIPSSYEVNVSKLFETNLVKYFKIFLPVVSGNRNMNFFEWKKNDILRINKYGILEPFQLAKKIIPDVMLVPLLAYDNKNYRLGYGGGFYDKFLNKYLKTNNKILTIGVAFSFQKYNKLPINRDDVKLDFILTEKGIF